jgi:heat shock protein HtpX
LKKKITLVAISTGLNDNVSEKEVEALLGHKISHLANGDMITLFLIQGVVNTFVIFFSRVVGFLVDRLALKVKRGHGPAFWIISMVAEMIFGILPMMIVMGFSRWRQFLADKGGAAIAGRENRIHTLQRLQTTKDNPKLPNKRQPSPPMLVIYNIYSQATRHSKNSSPH